jgi:hypothetical protein
VGPQWCHCCGCRCHLLLRRRNNAQAVHTTASGLCSGVGSAAQLRLCGASTKTTAFGGQQSELREHAREGRQKSSVPMY